MSKRVPLFAYCNWAWMKPRARVLPKKMASTCWQERAFVEAQLRALVANALHFGVWGPSRENGNSIPLAGRAAELASSRGNVWHPT